MNPRTFLPLLLIFLLPFAAPSARAEDESALGAATSDVKPEPKSKKKTPPKKKGFDYERSKYKSKEPAQTTNYRFNEKGEPVSADKKKAPAKKKKRSEPPEVTEESAEACGSDSSCIEKKADADAL